MSLEGGPPILTQKETPKQSLQLSPGPPSCGGGGRAGDTLTAPDSKLVALGVAADHEAAPRAGRRPSQLRLRPLRDAEGGTPTRKWPCDSALVPLRHRLGPTCLPSNLPSDAPSTAQTLMQGYTDPEKAGKHETTKRQ